MPQQRRCKSSTQKCGLEIVFVVLLDPTILPPAIFHFSKPVMEKLKLEQQSFASTGCEFGHILARLTPSLWAQTTLSQKSLKTTENLGGKRTSGTRTR